MAEKEETKPAEGAKVEEKKGDGDKGTQGKSAGGGGGGGNNKNGRNYRDRTPPEEEFDLSKPIPRVPKPNKDEHDKELAALDEEIEKAKTERNKVQKQIDGIYDNNKKSGIGKAKDDLQKLRQKKGQLIGEKKAIQNKYNATKSEADKIMKDNKATKQNVRFTKLEDIEKELQKLQRKQETTNMSLTEEKKLLREMDALNKSKQAVSQLKDKEKSFEDVKEQRKAIGAQINAKDKEIDAVAAEIKKKDAEIKQLIEKESDKRSHVDTIVKRRDELRDKMTALIKQKDEIKKKFREKNDVYYKHQRALKAQQRLQIEERKKKEEEERQEYLKKLEEEEAKKIPYEEEKALCDYLADYLTKTYLGGSDTKQEEKQKDFVAVKDDPFSGMKAMNKKNDDEDVYFGKGKGKKKRVRNAKKQDQTAGPFTLSVDTFEQFGWIGLTPPTSVDMVEKSVKELKEKKEWYSKQPRGSVPTASDIRKSNEKAAKTRHSKNGESNNNNSNNNNNNGSARKSGGQKFALSIDDFAPLAGSSGTASTSTPFNSSWGKGSSAASAAAASPSGEAKEEKSEPTPAEASGDGKSEEKKETSSSESAKEVAAS